MTLGGADGTSLTVLNVSTYVHHEGEIIAVDF
jgi:hypothetical protein